MWNCRRTKCWRQLREMQELDFGKPFGLEEGFQRRAE
jgi:hypothetical protein